MTQEKPSFVASTLPKKGRMRYVLYSRSSRRRWIDERRPEENSRYRNKKLQIDLPVDGGMAWNGGTEVWIDVDKGVQIDYPGLNGWVGIDGRFSYKAEVGKQWAQVQAAKMGDLLKWGKILVGLVVVAVLSPFVALLLSGT